MGSIAAPPTWIKNTATIQTGFITKSLPLMTMKRETPGEPRVGEVKKSDIDDGRQPYGWQEDYVS